MPSGGLLRDPQCSRRSSPWLERVWRGVCGVGWVYALDVMRGVADGMGQSGESESAVEGKQLRPNAGNGNRRDFFLISGLIFQIHFNAFTPRRPLVHG